MVSKEMERLKDNCLVIKSPQIHRYDDTWIKIGHHNVRGYITNMNDIITNKIVCSPDIICFTETHLNPTNVIASTCQPHQDYIPFRNDRQQDDAKGGVIVFANPKYKPQSKLLSDVAIEYVAITISPRQCFTLQVIAIYNPPTSKQDFIQQTQFLLDAANVKDIPTIIVGDFNEDLLTKPSNSLTALLESYNFTQKITEPTTDYGSLLDHIYHNMALTEEHYEVVDMYYSDHDAIFMALKHP
jgi:exonuclease III